jgi:hypothetical protein
MKYLTLLTLIISSIADAGSVAYPASGERPLTQQAPAEGSLQRAEHFFSQNQFDSALVRHDISAKQFKSQTN